MTDVQDRTRNGQKCKKRIKVPRKIWHLRFQIERTTKEFNREALGLDFLKRANGMSSGLLKIRNSNLWRFCPLQKLHIEEEPIM
jgi:hypothetical protein